MSLLLAATVKNSDSAWLSFNSLPPNGLFYAFLVFLVLVYLFETYIDYRQHRLYFVTTKPPQLTWVTPQQFVLAQEYGLDKSKLAFASSAFSTVKLLTFLLLGLYPRLWELSGELAASIGLSQSVMAQSLIFFSIEQTLDQLLNVPLSAYKTFVIEQRHGFNQQTVELFITDTIKTLALTILIGCPIVALLLLIIDSAGPHFYLYVTVLVLAIQLLAMAVFPTLIQPLFNKVEALPKGDLRDAIEQLASDVGFPLKKLFQIDGSKRSSHSNAYMYGFCGSKSIVIYDTLIHQSTIPEVVAVLAHEIGHWKLNHSIKNLVLMQLQTAILFYTFSLTLTQPRLYSDFGFSGQRATYIGLLLFQFLYSPIAHVTQFLSHVLSRRFEYEADEYAVRLGKGEELAKGLVVLHKENKGTMINDPWWSAYHHSHPPVLDRLKAIERKKKA